MLSESSSESLKPMIIDNPKDPFISNSHETIAATMASLSSNFFFPTLTPTTSTTQQLQQLHLKTHRIGNPPFPKMLNLIPLHFILNLPIISGIFLIICNIHNNLVIILILIYLPFSYTDSIDKALPNDA